jgi:IS4 transposase
VKPHLQKLTENDVVIYDRGFFGYEFLLHHIDKGVHGVFRLQTGNQMKQIADFINDRNRGDDLIIELVPDAVAQKKLLKKWPEMQIRQIALRLIRYEIHGETYFIATTLMDKKFSTEEFRDIYHSRWGIEEFYKTYKIQIDPEDLHSKSERGVLQEIFAAFVIANMSRILVNQAQEKVESSSTTETNSDDTCHNPEAAAENSIPKKSLRYPRELAFRADKRRSMVKAALSF